MTSCVVQWDPLHIRPTYIRLYFRRPSFPQFWKGCMATFCGHLCAERALLRARQICYWPYMLRDIYKFCTDCLPSQSHSSPTPQGRAPLQSIHADRPFQRIVADITELPMNTQGNKYILAVVDFFSHYANLYFLKDQWAPTVQFLSAYLSTISGNMGFQSPYTHIKEHGLSQT